jgi:hypothetical protein
MLDPEVAARLRAAGERQLAATVDFCQWLIRQPSMPGEEGALAELVRAEFGRLGYDDAWIDRGGNVIGVLRGVGGGRSLMLNTHLDHVGVGDPAEWPLRPFAADIVDGVLYGRGASDIKVHGGWCSLYRAIDRDVNFVEALLSEQRDIAAAQRSFTQALGTVSHAPAQVTTEGHDAYSHAIRETLGSAVRHRTSHHKNNRLE